jgi:hypothetical protein
VTRLQSAKFIFAVHGALVEIVFQSGTINTNMSKYK